MPRRDAQQRFSRPRTRHALTVIELGIVIIVMAVLALFGIRQVAKARLAVREQLAIDNLRTISTACQFYLRANLQYPPDLTMLGPSVSNPPYLSEALAKQTPVAQGYRFTYQTIDGQTFHLTADPIEYNVTGRRHFLADQTNTIHVTLEHREAGPTDEVVP